MHRPDGHVEPHPGGSPANVAVGLARLGTSATLVTRFGRDAYGDLLRGHLAGNGVVLAPGAEGPGETSVAVASLDAAGAATYTFRLAWDPAPLDSSLLAGAGCVHTGSLGTALPPGARVVRDLLTAAAGRVPVSYDPNLRPALLGPPEEVRRDVEELVALSDVVKASEEDLGWLHPGEAYEEVARRWLALGPALVVVTRGGDGAYARTQGYELRRPAVPVEVVDTVGAGDAFTAGLLDALVRTRRVGAGGSGRLTQLPADELDAALAAAITVSALTCSRAGADPPTRAELRAVSGVT
ncbi:MAG: carbohydrate kinase [Actinomycetota bacterium]|nr:carbohydrate kinase [Actinomycetota bacterium]